MIYDVTREITRTIVSEKVGRRQNAALIQETEQMLLHRLGDILCSASWSPAALFLNVSLTENIRIDSLVLFYEIHFITLTKSGVFMFIYIIIMERES